ncbi:type IV secretion protein Rhs [Chryseobacterium fluminis]|uniref:RHS repeat-associated core domain-containing protein n=1 Tax=Chryseobacterium fluminis TaxID=2983606 RepID=UPI002257BD9D|nr:RHS repeat-associated core domain-containing protein [Chryseobacterium sp. MMS21-Ot14]UZT99167.1 type IV secretion protein Rhs [Chryseobacterium sp. MMS21-Ot14]
MVKRYSVEYTNNGTNYQFVSKINEYNSNSSTDAANPVTLNYPPLVNSSYAEYAAEPDPFTDVKLIGDFNGDSYLDFLMNNGTVKLGAFNESFTAISTGKTFAGNAKLVSTLLDEEGQVYNGNGIVEYKNQRIFGYIFRNNTFEKVFEKNLANTAYAGFDDNVKIEVGDFDGDGIPDVFIDDGAPPGFNSRGIIDLKNPSTLHSSIVSLINDSSYPDQKYMDIDGDGKVKIISVGGSRYTVFEFVKINTNQYEKKIRFSGNLLETKEPEFPVLFGDYNGDGKVDFAIPITDNAVGKPDDWRFYIGTEKGFTPFLKKEFFTYRKFQKEMTGNYAKFTKEYFFSVTDMNKDGKSDIVQVFSYNQINTFNTNYRNFGYVVNAKMASGSELNGTPNFGAGWTFQSPQYQVQDIFDLTLFTPVTNSIKSGNNYYNVFLYWKQHLKKIKGPTPLSELARVSSITQGGVTTSIKYLEAVPNNPVLPNFYKKEKKELYPYYSLTRADHAYAVSQLAEEGRKQDFRYKGLTGNMHGKKMLGYLQTARSSWYADGFENTKIWSGSEIDPLLDGAPVKQWSIRTNNENNIFPSDISENNAQLLSFESVSYKTDKLLNGQVVTTIPAVYTNWIVTASVPKATKTKDFLTGTLTEKIITYGSYYLPYRTVTSINNGYSVSSAEFNYQHNIGGTGKNYYIGRPVSKLEKAEAYNDTQSDLTTYTYDNNLLKSSTFSPGANMSNSIVEEYSYDGFGNIILKNTKSALDGNSRTESAEYDPQGRYVIKKTDHLGLQTVYQYNTLGLVLNETDPDGNTVTNTYDHWGKLLTSTSSLLGTTTLQYNRDSGYNATVTQNNPDGDISRIFTNKLGQEYKMSTKAFAQGQYISRESQYDILGRKLKVSEPYFEGQAASQWNTFLYDDNVFPAKVTFTGFNGKQTETTVSGFTTSVKETHPADYGRITSRTIDALGNIISSTDPGGTVQFTYNAAGQQIKAQYEDHIVTTKYDDWGNKIMVNDPSNGEYIYEYGGFMGALLKVKSPKGEKNYQYNSLGQLTLQKEVSSTGDETDKVINFSYNNKGRLAFKKGTSNGKDYSYNITYDPQGKEIAVYQQNPEAKFSQKNTIYDNKGRVISYEKEIESSGAITTASIKNVYSAWNGELYQVKDNKSGKILWELKETNAKGLVIRSKLGAADIVNAYDANGLLTHINHSSSLKPNILKISYSFDAIRNELRYRKTEGNFDIKENFEYDDNNRLANWTDPITGILPSGIRNIYDKKGRILENDQVGIVNFENSAKIYQPTGLTLNAAGTQNYNNDLIQSIIYNENNDPVFIDGEKGDVAFRYGLTAMRQRVTYGGQFSRDEDGRYTKIYSEDGSFEIIKDNKTGSDKHIIYIGANPYESNIVYLKNYDQSSGSFLFLHKDYLGSILAISEETGTKLEQRHFDAWGNFTHLKIKDGPVALGSSIPAAIEAFGSLYIDRGYTSHEHFMEVGIIHMNGRLYDPLLRRFLNADENIQDPFNTQFYNKYGYVVNNPLMYADPNGEFAWIVVGAVIGAYVTGAKANGSWNPVEWNWGATWGKIVMGGAIGAFTGGVGAAVGASAATFAAASWGIQGGLLGGAIAGVSGGAVAGALSGFATSVMFGENVLQGTLMGGLSGAVIGGVVGGVTGAVQQALRNVQAATTGAPKGTILKGVPVEAGRSPWTLNNTPKTATVGLTPKGKTLTIGDIDIATDIQIGTKYNPVTESYETITIEGPASTNNGQYTKTVNNEGTSVKISKGALVQANRTAGNAFRDELADALRAEGKVVKTEVYKKTPYGKRYMDIQVKMPNGKSAGIETKVGGSRYHTLQKLKDDWLRANGYPVQVVRKK